MDLTIWIDPADDPSRTLTLNFTADGTAHTLRVHPETDPSTFWLEAASAVCNMDAGGHSSVSFDAAANTINLFDSDGSLTQSMEVILT